MVTTALPRSMARALASLTILAALSAGVPSVLVRVSRAQFSGPFPWSGIDPPGSWSLEQVGDALSTRATDSLISDVLLRSSIVTVWVAVALLVATVVAEVIHQIRHDGIGLPTVRGLSWGQPTARFIATGLLVIASLFATSRVSAAPTLPVREVAVTAVLEAEPRIPVAPDHSAIAPGATDDDANTSYVVVPGDSVYAIAERLAGRDRGATVTIADQILDLNLGSVMPDGQRFANAAYIEPGWVLRIPVVEVSTPGRQVATADSRHIVTPGDTLSSIAAGHLGDGRRWPEIWDVNAGHEMSDGRTFDDPHLIIPGWELAIPTHEDPVEEVDEVDRVEEVDEVGGLEVVAVHSEAPPSVVDPAALPASPPAPAPTSRSVTSSMPSTTTTSTTSTIPSVVSADPDVGTEDPVAPSSPAPIGLGQAAMLSAGLLALITALRGRRLRAARSGARVPTPRPESIATERTLRAVDTADVGERVLRVDLALRCAAAEIADRDRHVLVALAGRDGSVELLFSGPCDLAEPWIGRAERWTLPGEVPVETLAPLARSVGAPCPAVVNVGVSTDGRDVHLDLEAVGVLAVDAPPAVADEVVAGLAATLGNSPFAEAARLIRVGVPATAFVAHRSVDAASTVAEALELAHDLLGTTSDLDETTFAARARMQGGEAWEPAVVLAGSSAAPHPGGLVVTRGRGLAVVVVGTEPGTGARLTLDGPQWRLLIGDETTSGPAIDLIPVGLTSAELRQVDELVTDAAAPLDVGDPTVLDPEESPAVMRIDAGVEAPPWSIMVRVLGPVDVVDRHASAAVFEKSKALELIAWLATHRDRPTRTAARTALWDLDVRDATFANVVSAARRTIARLVPPPEGQEWLARTQTERLPLHADVVSDADVLAERLATSRGRAAQAAVEILEPAVALIRGMPFESTTYLWPDADGLSSNLVVLATTAAAELAHHHLGLGDVEGVFRATGRGLLALPGHEELIALRMRAHARAGDHAGIRHEWESYERVVTSDPWSDGEPAPKLVELRRELLSPST